MQPNWIYITVASFLSYFVLRRLLPKKSILDKLSEEEKSVKVFFINNQVKRESIISSLFSSDEDSYIGCSLSEKICRGIRDCIKSLKGDDDEKKVKEIHFVVDTPGGALSAITSIVEILKEYQSLGGLVKVYAPYRAQSAGTILALAANEIYANSTTRFSYIDVQMGLPFLGSYSIKDFIDLEKQYPSVITAIFAKEARRTENTYKKLIDKICDCDKAKAETVWKSLVEHDSLHGEIVSPGLLEKLGFKVHYGEGSIPSKYMKLFSRER